MTDYSEMARTFSAPSSETQIRQGVCVSHEAGSTCTINVQGTVLAGCQYLQPPRPGTPVWFIWQGGVPFVLGTFSYMDTPPSLMHWHTGTWGFPEGAWSYLGAGVSSPNYWGADDWGMWDAGTGLVTAPLDGWYQLSGHTTFDTVGQTHVRGAQFSGGTTDWGTHLATLPPSYWPTTTTNISYLVRVAKGTTFGIRGYQWSNGVAVNLTSYSIRVVYVGAI